MAKKKHIGDAKLEVIRHQSATEYLHEDYKDYAMHTILHRAIPSFVDGLKPVQRKIIATAMQHAKHLINVSALQGAMKHNFEYHHGEASGNQAIIVMNQTFQQALPYLEADGQFGWLYDRSPSAPRYLDTKVSKWTNLLMRADEDLLNHEYENGKKLEPITYLPILPMLLINGTDGIAVGFSTTFVNRNPLEVAYATRQYLETKKLDERIKLTPYVNGHRGLWSWWQGKYEHVATFHRFAPTIYRIEGLPIDTQIDAYLAKLTAMFHQGLITDFFNFSNDDSICIDVHMHVEVADAYEANNTFARDFNLIYRLPNDNLTCILPNKTWKRYDNPCQFIKEFVDYRLGVYTARKNKILADIDAKISWLESVIRYIDLIYANSIDFRVMTEAQVLSVLEQHKVNPRVLDIKSRQLTTDNRHKHTQSIDALKTERKIVDKTKERAMYLNDVNNLIKEIEKEVVIEDVLNIQNDANLIRINA
jgi:DNA topoisomerase-2